MCNRYQQPEKESLMRALEVQDAEAFNNAGSIIHPKSQGEVIRNKNDVRTLCQMTWGFPLILSAARKRAEEQGKRAKPKPVNNARTDKLSSTFWKRWTEPEYRCLIPIARYAEAYGPKGNMKEAWVSIPNLELFAVAGLWRPSLEWGNCYTMVMTDAAGDAAQVHSRMPVILASEQHVGSWLTDPVEEVIELCCPRPNDMKIEWSENLWINRKEGTLG